VDFQFPLELDVGVFSTSSMHRPEGPQTRSYLLWEDSVVNGAGWMDLQSIFIEAYTCSVVIFLY
jgi:hypothetical protein